MLLTRSSVTLSTMDSLGPEEGAEGVSPWTSLAAPRAVLVTIDVRPSPTELAKAEKELIGDVYCSAFFGCVDCWTGGEAGD